MGSPFSFPGVDDTLFEYVCGRLALVALARGSVTGAEVAGEVTVGEDGVAEVHGVGTEPGTVNLLPGVVPLFGAGLVLSGGNAPDQPFAILFDGRPILRLLGGIAPVAPPAPDAVPDPSAASS